MQDSIKILINIKDVTPEQVALYREIFSKYLDKAHQINFRDSKWSDLFKIDRKYKTFYWFPFNEDERTNEQEFFLKDISDIYSFETFFLDYINFNPKIHKIR